MRFSSQELLSATLQFNPWLTTGVGKPNVPVWKRRVFNEVLNWVEQPVQNRTLALGGARQVGKTTIFLQTINALIEKGTPPGNIFYCTFDHPLFSLAGIDDCIRLWREIQPRQEGPEYLFLDEIQSVPNWQVWIKHQADFNPERHIAITGSAAGLLMEKAESGVGRIHTIPLPTLSFNEYLQLRQSAGKQEPIPRLELPQNWEELFDWSETQFMTVSHVFEPLQGLFNEYLFRGGFPRNSLVNSIELVQQLLREDILDKVLKRDMTSLYGVRRIQELETLFLYLCMHDGGILDFSAVTENLGITKKTVQNYLDLFQSTYLLRQIRAFGYGKQVLRSQIKTYLSDPAIASSVLVYGLSTQDNPEKMGKIIESCCFKHLYDRYSPAGGVLSYWRGRNEKEVDFVLQTGDKLIPFEVKYRNQHTRNENLSGLLEFSKQNHVHRAVVFTKNMDDFRLETINDLTILHLPAALGCYMLN